MIDFDNDDLSVDDLRAWVLSDEAAVLLMIINGNPLLQHLALAAQLYEHAVELNRDARRMRAVATEPEHRELADSMRTAARGARIAFDAALNAVWQMWWLNKHCTCEDCVQERRKESAGMN